MAVPFFFSGEEIKNENEMFESKENFKIPVPAGRFHSQHEDVITGRQREGQQPLSMIKQELDADCESGGHVQGFHISGSRPGLPRLTPIAQTLKTNFLERSDERERSNMRQRQHTTALDNYTNRCSGSNPPPPPLRRVHNEAGVHAPPFALSSLQESPRTVYIKLGNYNEYCASILANLRTQDYELKDATLFCEGKSIRCHKMVLSMSSIYFEKLLKENPNPHPIFFFTDMSFQEMKALVDFMYGDEITIHPEKLQSFLRVAERLKIKGLEQAAPPPGNGTSYVRWILPETYDYTNLGRIVGTGGARLSSRDGSAALRKCSPYDVNGIAYQLEPNVPRTQTPAFKCNPKITASTRISSAAELHTHSTSTLGREETPSPATPVAVADSEISGPSEAKRMKPQLQSYRIQRRPTTRSISRTNGTLGTNNDVSKTTSGLISRNNTNDISISKEGNRNDMTDKCSEPSNDTEEQYVASLSHCTVTRIN